jgi:hypothetical protein
VPEPVRHAVTGKALATQAIHVAPGKVIHAAVAPDDVPRYGVFRMVRQPDGSYLPVLKTFDALMKLDDVLDMLRIAGLSRRTLARLIETGFVECTWPSPYVRLVNVESLVEHLVAARDPEFWTPARRAQFGKGWKS